MIKFVKTNQLKNPCKKDCSSSESDSNSESSKCGTDNNSPDCKYLDEVNCDCRLCKYCLDEDKSDCNYTWEHNLPREQCNTKDDCCDENSDKCEFDKKYCQYKDHCFNTKTNEINDRIKKNKITT